MPRTVYALLVGIDAYPKPMTPLRGCVRDIQAMESLLEARTQAAGDTLRCHRLLNSEATREAVLSGLESHLTQAGASDAALFCYSGHGSRMPLPEAYRDMDPARELETLVCVDSRTEGQTDLFDKELAVRIARIAERAGHVLVILDSCHSGSGTRVPGPDVRLATDDTRPLDATRLARMMDRAAPLFARGGAGAEPARRFLLPRGRHVLLAACTADQLAAETSDLEGGRRGAFSLFLTEALDRSPSFPTYRDLFNRVHSQVVRHCANQSPLIQSAFDEDFDRPFLGGDIVTQDRHHSATQYQYQRWKIDAGEMQGMPRPAPDAQTRLALFETGVTEFSDLSRSIGDATLTATFPGHSTIEPRFAPGFVAGPETTLRAVVTSWPAQPMDVALLGDEDGIAQLRAAIAASGPGGGPSLLVRERLAGAALAVHAGPDGFRITHPAETRALCADTPSAKCIATRLQDIARWHRLATRSPPENGLPEDALEMALFDSEGSESVDGGPPLTEDAGGEVRLDYRRQDGGEWKPVQVSIRLTNRSEKRLYCLLLELTPGFGIRPLAMSGTVGGSGRWLGRGESAWILDSDAALKADVPDHLQDLGWSEARKILKLFVSTESSDASLMAQPDVDAGVRPGELSRSELERRPSTFLGARGEGGDVQQWGPVIAWTTKQVTIVSRIPATRGS